MDGNHVPQHGDFDGGSDNSSLSDLSSVHDFPDDNDDSMTRLSALSARLGSRQAALLATESQIGPTADTTGTLEPQDRAVGTSMGDHYRQLLKESSKKSTADRLRIATEESVERASETVLGPPETLTNGCEKSSIEPSRLIDGLGTDPVNRQQNETSDMTTEACTPVITCWPNGPLHVSTLQPTRQLTGDGRSELAEEGPSRVTAAIPMPAEVADTRGRARASLPSPQNEMRQAFSSAFSTVTEPSELSSVHTAVSSEATTPGYGDDPSDAIVPSLETTATSTTPSHIASQPESISISQPAFSAAQAHDFPSTPHRCPLSKRNHHKARPKASIPLNLSMQEYAAQCIAAAESSRLNPYALHEEEYALLRQHIGLAQVTTYLNIRNGILRLWLRKPHVAVTRNEAIGCAKDSRWFDAAGLCFDWLVRRGYVNFGCVDIKRAQKAKAALTTASLPKHAGALVAKRRKKIVVVGAGMSGLGCARQLENLFKQYSDHFDDVDEPLPEVVVLEGRSRVGGRVYSRAFHIQPRHLVPGFGQSRCTAEMGGMIITGFDRGNPMNILVRGQLGLGYHALLSTTTLYDINGKPVDSVRDGMIENLFNECLDRVSEYKYKLPVPKVIEGKRDLMDEGRDSSAEGQKTIATTENLAALQAVPAMTASPAMSLASTTTQLLPSAQNAEGLEQADLVRVSSDRLTGRAHLEPGTLATQNAAHKVGIMGWTLKPGVCESRDLDLDQAANAPGATLGFVVEEAIKQYRDLIDLNAQDLRLLNWHIANLEYSNAINQDCLSLFGWDIDAGNEWEGKHSMVIGGYQGVPRGLMLCPTPLDVQRQMVVKKITYSGGEDDTEVERGSKKTSPAIVECEGGHTFEADYVVNTIPLGVLKHGDVEFSPPLPPWKMDVIGRLGYGVLNKVVLTYRQPFWDPDRDIFGVLREPKNRLSLNQKEYSQRRGRMFQWFNVSKTTGIPCLVALMAGDAAYDTEKSSNDELVAEATSILRNVFGAQNVPDPIEAVVTRWASDKFARGSYSSAGPDMKIDDYDVMARPVGKTLFFAGEHTIGTHPATVHGAYLSGLRVASEIFDELVGPIHVPTPLVLPKETGVQSFKRKTVLEDDGGLGGEESSGSVSAGGSASSYRGAKANSRMRMEAREMRIQEYIQGRIGSRPERPPRVADNSYLLFSKANFDRARKKCEEGRRPGKGRPLPNEVRVLTSKMWRSASSEERRPYAEQAAELKRAYEAALKEYIGKCADWERQAAEIRVRYEKENPPVDGDQEASSTPQDASPSAPDSLAGTPCQPSPYGGRRLRRMTSYLVDDDSDVDMTG